MLRAIMGPLGRHQALAMTVYESEMDAYQCQLQQQPVTPWDAETLTPPVCSRYLVNEATVEKVHVILKENPQGVLYMRDELSGWTAQLDRRGRERAFFLESWDERSYASLRQSASSRSSAT